MKPLITANTIIKAAENGQTSLSVRPGSIITPAARDEAKTRGIVLDFNQTPPDVKECAVKQNTGELGNIDSDIIQKIVREVLLQIACGQGTFRRDISGVKHIKSEPREFLAHPDEARLMYKTMLSGEKNQPDVSMFLLEDPQSILYKPQNNELILLMQGCLILSADGGECTVMPGDALVLTAGKTISLLAKNRTVWFSLNSETIKN